MIKPVLTGLLALGPVLTSAKVQPAAESYSFDPLQHLAGIAPYFAPEDPPLDPSPPQGCNVTRAAYLVRHAAIYANDFDYEEYIEPFVEKLGNSTQDWSKSRSLSFLANWTAPISDSEIEDLTNFGQQEAMRLGIDVEQRYPGLGLPEKVWTSTAERTVKSAQGFIRGLAQKSNDTQLVKVSESEERGADSLTPYESCPGYSSSAGSHQSQEFVQRYTKPILARFKDMAPSFNWTADDIFGMQELCGYETVIRGSSPFCSLDLFTPNEWLSFEYANDIMYHYNTGYGSNLSPVIGYPWVNATAQQLFASANDSSAQDIYVSFTHRELPPTVLVALNLFNNSAFTGANHINATMPTNAINYGRQWISSSILPFLTNIAIEKLGCDSYGYDPSVNEYYRVLVNSAPQPLVGCRDGPGESCSRRAFEEFVQDRGRLYGDFSKACDVDYKNSTNILTIYENA